MPENIIMTESGTAPSNGRTTPPIIPAGKPRSSNSSAPSANNQMLIIMY